MNESELSPQRQRQKRFLAASASLDDKELLTFLLSYIHSDDRAAAMTEILFAQFGTLEAILCAGIDRLRDAGLSDSAAVLLRLVLTAQSVSAASGFASLPPLSTAAETGRYLVRLFAGFDTEHLYMLLLDERFRVIDLMPVSEGNVASVDMKARDMAARASRCNAAFAVLAHNHPSGSTTPSDADLLSTEMMCDALAVLEIPMLEHFLIAGHSWRPLLLAMDKISEACPDGYYPPELLQHMRGCDKHRMGF